MENEVKISDGRETRTIMMRHPPAAGEVLSVGGDDWLVRSVSYTVPYRIPAESLAAMNFTVTEEEVA